MGDDPQPLSARYNLIQKKSKNTPRTNRGLAEARSVARSVGRKETPPWAWLSSCLRALRSPGVRGRSFVCYAQWLVRGAGLAGRRRKWFHGGEGRTTCYPVPYVPNHPTGAACTSQNNCSTGPTDETNKGGSQFFGLIYIYNGAKNSVCRCHCHQKKEPPATGPANNPAHHKRLDFFYQRPSVSIGRTDLVDTSYSVYSGLLYIYIYIFLDLKTARTNLRCSLPSECHVL